MQCGIRLCNLILTDFLLKIIIGEKMEFGIAACGQQNGPMDGIALHVPDIIMAP